MDMSLDDYINVRSSRGSRGGGGRGRGRGGGRPMPAGFTRPPRDRMEQTRVSPTKKGSILSRLGSANQRGNGSANQMRGRGNSSGNQMRNLKLVSSASVGQVFKTKPLAMDGADPMKAVTKSSTNMPDARQKLTQKLTKNDARMKISKNDARMKIVSKSKTGITDARARIHAKKVVGSSTVEVKRTVNTDGAIWRKTTVPINLAPLTDELGRPVREEHEAFGITRTINQDSESNYGEDEPRMNLDDGGDITIVRNFRPSLATFSSDPATADGERPSLASGLEVRITRKLPSAQSVYSLPDYSELLRDTQRKLEAGHGDQYYGKMVADQEVSAKYTKVAKVRQKEALPVEAPLITINNDKIPMETSQPVAKKAPEIPKETDDKISPLQGFKIVITNLHPAVTQDDIIELFASIGALKKARLLKKGNAEVVFVKKEDALTAVKRYHNRLLDNMPMYVKSVFAATPKVVKESSEASKQTKQQAMDLDIDVVHKALFRNSKEVAVQPVQFLVKI